jgi:hypothetical protein
MPGACGGVIAVVALDQKDGSIDNTQSAALRFTNWLDLSNTNNPPTPFKANLTIAAPGECRKPPAAAVPVVYSTPASLFCYTWGGGGRPPVGRTQQPSKPDCRGPDG